MQSAAIPRDAGPNKDAIAMLERAARAPIPNYAPTWEALGHRYYYDAVYSGGGPEGYQRSNAAYQKALALDRGAPMLPDLWQSTLPTPDTSRKDLKTHESW